MKTRFPLLLPLALGGFLALVLLLLLPRDWMGGWAVDTGGRRQVLPESKSKTPLSPDPVAEHPGIAEDLPVDPRWAEVSEKVLEMLRRRLEGRDARDKEALLTFKSEEAYRKFLERAAAAGLTVRGKMEAFNAVRVSYDSLNQLQSDIMGNAADYGDVSANYYAYMPETPAKEERAAQTEVPFGDEMLPFLGIFGDHSSYGKGVTVAVLDSGVTPYAGIPEGQIQYIDIGQGMTGTGSEDGHGTAVGYLLGQVAPGADILSIRVTGSDGVSDLFTLAQGIQTAVDKGASVINISLGAYQNSLVLSSAVEYAFSHGVAVVASAGNDQAAQLTWPAADTRVISVGAVDKLGQQATFSNSGDTLTISAPGYGLNTPWLDGSTVAFDGTSASAPIMAGLVAAVTSLYNVTPGEAKSMIAQYSNDAGAPGVDASYGAGIPNLAWLLNSSNPNYYDPAISSQYYNNATGQMEVIIQNRSGASLRGLTLQVAEGGDMGTLNVPALNAGASYVVALPIDRQALNSGNQVTVQSRLVNPAGVPDAFPSNNARTSVISKK